MPPGSDVKATPSDWGTDELIITLPAGEEE
jgi:hypothetical protein